jgi:pimeloyl-ACP methyl ester carboxylesterase
MNNNITEEQKTNGAEHQKRVFEENTIYNDYLPILKKIEALSLLVVGDHDPICCKIQQDEFLKNSKNGMMKIVSNAGHLLYLSNVNEFVGLVRSFLIDCHE